MQFLTTLKDLEAGIAFFRYYRRYVYNYIYLVKSLNKLKTLSYRTVPRKGNTRERYGAIYSPKNTETVLELTLKQREKLVAKARAI